MQCLCPIPPRFLSTLSRVYDRTPLNPTQGGFEYPQLPQTETKEEGAMAAVASRAATLERSTKRDGGAEAPADMKLLEVSSVGGGSMKSGGGASVSKAVTDALQGLGLSTEEAEQMAEAMLEGPSRRASTDREVEALSEPSHSRKEHRRRHHRDRSRHGHDGDRSHHGDSSRHSHRSHRSRRHRDRDESSHRSRHRSSDRHRHKRSSSRSHSRSHRRHRSRHDDPARDTEEGSHDPREATGAAAAAAAAEDRSLSDDFLLSDTSNSDIEAPPPTATDRNSGATGSSRSRSSTLEAVERMQRKPSSDTIKSERRLDGVDEMSLVRGMEQLVEYMVRSGPMDSLRFESLLGVFKSLDQVQETAAVVRATPLTPILVSFFGAARHR